MDRMLHNDDGMNLAKYSQSCLTALPYRLLVNEMEWMEQVCKSHVLMLSAQRLRICIWATLHKVRTHHTTHAWHSHGYRLDYTTGMRSGLSCSRLFLCELQLNSCSLRAIVLLTKLACAHTLCCDPCCRLCHQQGKARCKAAARRMREHGGTPGQWQAGQIGKLGGARPSQVVNCAGREAGLLTWALSQR